MILDDVLTGLDRSTEQNVLKSVFGKYGILKQAQTTAVLATNSGLSVLIPTVFAMLRGFSSPSAIRRSYRSS